MEPPYGSVPQRVRAWHCGRVPSGASFTDFLKYLRSGEGNIYLGPGIYFTTDRASAIRYCRYTQNAPVLYEAIIDLTAFYDSVWGQPEYMIRRIRSAERAAGLRKDAFSPDDFRYGKNTIGAIHAKLGAEKAVRLLIEHGIYGAIESLSYGGKQTWEIAVFNPRTVRVIARYPMATAGVEGGEPVQATIRRNHVAPGVDECEDSEALFHVTSFANLAGIARHGLVPRSGGGTFSHGGYGAHSQGKVFLACGRGAALAWYSKVQDQLHYHHQDDEEPDALVPVMLMVSPEALGEVFVDEAGDRDVPGSVYVQAPIPPDAIAFWSPADGWVAVEEWEDEDPYDGVESIEHYDDEGDVVEEDEDWTSRAFETFGPYDPGGFKPDPDDDEPWEPF